MTTVDPIRLAKKLERLGLLEEAITVLRNARIDDPANAELRRMEGDLRHASSMRGRLLVRLHLVMAWVLLLAVVAALFGPFIYALGSIGDGAPTPPLPGGLPAALLAVAAVLGLLGYLSVLLFLLAWFFYLKHVARRDRWRVELRLPSSMNMATLQPLYGRVRRRFFPDEET